MRLLLSLILVGWAAGATGALTNRFPVKDASNQDQVYAAFNRAPRESVTTLVDALASTQTVERVAAEYALDGWSTYTLRPGAGAGERGELASALVSFLAPAAGPDWNATGAFLLGQLGKVGVRESVEPLARLLSEPDWVQDAALALQAFALPTYAGPVRDAVLHALPGAEGRHGEILHHLLRRTAGDPVFREQAPQVFRERIATRQPGEPAHQVCYALVALADLQSDEAFPDIAGAMDHPDASVRGTARRLMASCDAPQVSPWLLGRLASEDPQQRAEALVLLTGRRDPNVFSRAQALLNDESEVVRQAAYDACAALGETGVVDDLLAAYVPADQGDRAALLAALVHRKGVGIADQAHARLVASDDPRVQAAMWEIIGACMARGYVDEALAAIHAGDEGLAKQAAKTAGRLVGRAQAEPLIELLQDVDLEPSLQSRLIPATVAALNEAAVESERIDPVAAALSGADGPGRRNLHRVLSGLQTGEAVVLLKAETSHGDPANQDSAVRALCARKGYNAVEALLDVARTTTNETHNILALRRVVQLVQQRVPADSENEELREEARQRYGTALAAAVRDDERTMIREALDGLTPEPEAPDAEATH